MVLCQKVDALLVFLMVGQENSLYNKLEEVNKSNKVNDRRKTDILTCSTCINYHVLWYELLSTQVKSICTKYKWNHQNTT